MKTTWKQSAASWAAVACIGSALTGTALADYPAATTALNPVIYLPLNSTAPAPAEPVGANLGSLSSLVATYTGGPTRGLPGAISGDADTSAQVAGGQISVPFSAEYNPNGPFSVEAWLRPSALPGALTSPLSSANAGDPRSGWFFYQIANGDGWNFRMFTGVGLGTAVDISAFVPLEVDVWYHVAVTYDGTTARIYVNGVEGGSGDPVNYVANRGGRLVVGARSDLAFAWSGGADEVALYNSSLSAARVAAHYAAGTGGGSYTATVQADAPTVYLRLGEGPLIFPTATNVGTLGSAADAIHLPGTTPGTPALAAPAAAGFSTTNRSVALDGTNGIVRIPAQDGVSVTEASITGWIWRDGTQPAFAGVVFRRGTGVAATGLNFIGNGTTLGYHWEDLPASYNFGSGLVVPDRQWTFVALTVNADQAVLYMGTPSGLSAATNIAFHGTHDFGNGVTTEIGRDATGGRQFRGRVDEVAIFDRALTTAEVQTLYSAALPAILAVRQTPADPIYEGLNVTYQAVVARTATVTYQWRKEGQPLSGQTASSLVLPSVSFPDVASYDVIARIGSTSLTSAPVSLAIVSSAPVVSAPPTSATRFLNGTVRFTTAAVGTQPMEFTWRKGETLVGSGPTLTITDLQASDAGTYTVTISNPLGTNTASADLTLVTPTGYAAASTDAGPVAYWRLNETTGNIAQDYWGSFDAVARDTVVKGSAGPTGGGFASTNSAYTFNGSTTVEGPALNLNSANVTIVAWIKPNGAPDDYDGLVFARGGSTVAGLDYQQGGQLGYHWNDTSDTWGWGSGLYPEDGVWNFVALVVEPTQATLYLDSGTGLGLLGAVNGVTHGPEEFNGAIRFGSDSATGRFFNGSIDEVAVYNRSLSNDEITALQFAGRNGTYAPKTVAITGSPRSRTVMAGTSQVLAGSASGSVPLSFQWRKDGTNIPGAIRSRITIDPAALSDTGSYDLVVQQGVTTRSTTPATLTVLPVPSYLDAREGLVLHLPFDGALADTSGRGNNGTAVGAPTFTSGRIGSGALGYRTEVAEGAVTRADYVTLGTPTDLNFGTGSFSVAFWTKFTGSPGDLPFIGNNTGSYGGSGFTFAPSYGSGSWSWSLNDGVNPSGWPGVAAQYGNDAGYPDALNDGLWHHVVHIVDRSADVTTWVDGVKVHAKSIAGIDFNLDTGLAVVIGQDANGTYAEAGSFEMDDLGIWRRALTDFEAQAIHVVGSQFNRSFDVAPPTEVVVTVSVLDGNLILGWTSGTLQGTPTINGPWNAVPGATAPSASVTPTDDQRFFRVIQ